MSEISTPEVKTARRLDFSRILAVVRSPRRAFESIAAEGRSAWLTPMLVLTVALLLRVLVSGFFQARAAAMGEMPLPPDWQYWTPDMQNNYMQGIQATQGPAFVYIIPTVGALAGLWLGWVILSGLLHLVSTLFGGRGSMASALNVVAWASLPFAVRDLLRVVFMLIAGHPIASAGLSGFVSGTTGGALYLAQVLANVDLFFIWRAVLLVIGFRLADNLTGGKAAAGVLIVLLLALLAQAVLGFLGAGMGGMMNTPFY